MRGFRLFGGAKRNDPIELVDPHPIAKYEDPQHTGNVPLDGYSLLSRANPKSQGNAPAVEGVLGPAYFGPDESWEQ